MTTSKGHLHKRRLALHTRFPDASHDKLWRSPAPRNSVGASPGAGLSSLGTEAGCGALADLLFLTRGRMRGSSSCAELAWGGKQGKQ